MPLDLAATLAALPDPGTARLRTGVITAVPAATTVTVNIDGNPVTCMRLRSYPAAVGDVALIAHTPDGRLYALGALASGTAPIPPDPPPGPPSTGTATFPAQSAGSYRGGAWRTDRSDVIQGDFGGFGLNQGAWFYGTAPAQTLAGASITAARIHIDRRRGGFTAAADIRAYLHNAPVRPGSPPARLATATLGRLAVGARTWLALPLGWGQQIAAGTARGVGIYSATADPYVVLASLAQNGATGALQLTWQR